ncbi:Uncharacterised protein [Burkholderia oklahomensis]|nr:hypothetical protein BG90_1014 [Burkholderia oklahomensis C6786]SUW59566.1 Uncharacterised protein [Burkholderia oklahomensis]
MTLGRRHLKRLHDRKAAGDFRRRPYRMTNEPASLPTGFLLSPTSQARGRDVLFDMSGPALVPAL